MQVFPHVTHFYGQEVTKVNKYEEGYELILSGGGKIVDPRPTNELPSALKGAVLTGGTFLKHETVLTFGVEDNPLANRVSLDPSTYLVGRKDYEKGKLFLGQQPLAAVVEETPEEEEVGEETAAE